MGETKIEWATHTVNWLTGCTKVSPACTHCYAETMSRRMQHMPQAPERYAGVVDTGSGRWTGVVRYDADALARAFEGLRNARKPRRVFVNSMSDTFHADAPPASLDDLARRIRQVERFAQPGWPHVIMLLTKRPDRMLDWQREHFPDGLPSWVWCGVTVEDQRRAEERVPTLLRVATAGVRFLSCEPLLGPVDLDPTWCDSHGADHLQHMPPAQPWCVECDTEAGSPGWLDPGGIGWVITGGESGPGARPSHPVWFRVLRDECVEAGVPFHFKQHGAWAHADVPQDGDRWVGLDGGDRGPWIPGDGAWYPAGAVMRRVGKKAAGRLLDGRTWDEVPRA